MSNTEVPRADGPKHQRDDDTGSVADSSCCKPVWARATELTMCVTVVLATIGIALWLAVSTNDDYAQYTLTILAMAFAMATTGALLLPANMNMGTPGRKASGTKKAPLSPFGWFVRISGPGALWLAAAVILLNVVPASKVFPTYRYTYAEEHERTHRGWLDFPRWKTALASQYHFLFSPTMNTRCAEERRAQNERVCSIDPAENLGGLLNAAYMSSDDARRPENVHINTLFLVHDQYTMTKFQRVRGVRPHDAGRVVVQLSSSPTSTSGRVRSMSFIRDNDRSEHASVVAKLPNDQIEIATESFDLMIVSFYDERPLVERQHDAVCPDLEAQNTAEGVKGVSEKANNNIEKWHHDFFQVAINQFSTKPASSDLTILVRNRRLDLSSDAWLVHPVALAEKGATPLLFRRSTKNENNIGSPITMDNNVFKGDVGWGEVLVDLSNNLGDKRRSCFLKNVIEKASIPFDNDEDDFDWKRAKGVEVRESGVTGVMLVFASLGPKSDEEYG